MDKATIQTKLEKLTTEQREQLKEQYAEIMADAVEFSTFPVQVCLCEHNGEIYIDHFFQRADDTAIATIVSLDQPPFYSVMTKLVSYMPQPLKSFLAKQRYYSILRSSSILTNTKMISLAS